ncbi:MAG TPA: cytochrome c nitrite reductase small subunit [Planctomycetota bacterium]|nr:cytochrome c nitrite reductase small subunit [Planctomycetota bacterium]
MPLTNVHRWLFFALLCGVCLGVAGFTFDYAEGTSYLSRDPRACANCHIMQSQFDGWQKASHHTVAVCADCHLPQHGLEKWIAKASNGYRHSKTFTFQDFVEPIHMTARNAEILQANCERCHADLLHDQLASRREDDPLSCVHCHRSVGHGPRAAMGGFDTTPPLEKP